MLKRAKPLQLRSDDAAEIGGDADFDPAFVAEHYDAGLPPAHGAAQLIAAAGGPGFLSPSRTFDAVEYLSRNSDVLAASPDHPFVHWLRYGRAEKRATHRAGSAYPHLPDRLSLRQLAAPLAIPDLRWPRTALVIHIFYPEYVPWIVALLTACPPDVDLFVTSPDRAILAAFAEALAGRGLAQRLVVAHCNNRGRNFGPMLVEFGRALRDYAVVGHIHTKKSLYTGRPRYDWWLHAVSGVLTSQQHIQAVRLALSQDTGYGIVCAAKHPDLPFWAYHDLKNGPSTQYLFALLGQGGDVPPGFFDYPVGGMFWASRQVLEPLLARDWSYGDFPEEQGQIDGTLQHALERYMGRRAVALGLGTLKWLPGDHAYSAAPRPWIREFGTANSEASVRHALAAADTVSFDIFDTLLYRRTLHPETARHIVDRRSPGYAAARTAAEEDCRRQLPPGKDVAISDIAQAMVASGAVTLEQGFALLAREFAIDLSLMERREPVCRLVRHARSLGKRVVYISDMYLQGVAIRQILAQLGIPEPDLLLVSSEVGARKDRGDMWDHVKTLGLGRILHLGDNVVSDLQNPADRGIGSIFIPSLHDKASMLGLFGGAAALREHEALLFPILASYGVEPFFS